MNTKWSDIRPCTFEVSAHRAGLISNGLHQFGFDEVERSTPSQCDRIVAQCFFGFIQKTNLKLLPVAAVVYQNGIRQDTQAGRVIIGALRVFLGHLGGQCLQSVTVSQAVLGVDHRMQ